MLTKTLQISIAEKITAACRKVALAEITAIPKKKVQSIADWPSHFSVR